MHIYIQDHYTVVFFYLAFGEMGFGWLVGFVCFSTTVSQNRGSQVLPCAHIFSHGGL